MDISKVRTCRIHPAIGIARVGGSDEGYFIGPEIPGEVRVPPDPKYGFKDKHEQLLRQVARFRVYGYDAAGNVVAELTADNAEIEWGVHVANHKAAWYQFAEAMDIPSFDGSGGTPPQTSARRNAAMTGADRDKLVIDPGPRTITGRKTRGKKYQFDGGKFFGKSVSLGEARTDDAGRLLVFGGRGVSASKDGKPAITFANNDGWHDDVGDGPVTATVKVGGRTIDAGHAWVVVAPPDYAPGVIALTTMYDIIRDAGWQLDSSTRPAKPSFANDIGPIFQRLAQNQWVNAGFGKLWGFGSADNIASIMSTLASDTEYAKPLRESYFARFRDPAFTSIEPGLIPPVYGDGVNLPALDPREWYAITTLQYAMLRQWAAGDFIADYDPKATPAAKFEDIPLAGQPRALDVAALDNTIGGPFHPGCEMTWPMRQPIMYDEPFRLKLRKGPPKDYGATLDSAVCLAPGGPLDGSGPGDVSRWMAVPWQTDTSSCLFAYIGWQEGVFLPTFWPVRVPNNVLTDEQYATVMDAKKSYSERFDAFQFDNRQYWLRMLAPREDYKSVINEFVKEWNGVGVVTYMDGPTDKNDPYKSAFPSTMHVERGVTIEKKRKQKAALAMVAADQSQVSARPVDGGVRPRNLPNPRKFR
jgi:hypothetical protein